MGTGKERKDKIEVVAEWTRPDLLALDSDLKKQKEKEGKRLRWVVTENLETKKVRRLESRPGKGEETTRSPEWIAVDLWYSTQGDDPL